MSHLSAASPRRVLAVWAGATTALAGLLVLAWASLGPALPVLSGAPVGYGELLTALAAAVLLLAAPWCWCVVTLVALDALRGRERRRTGCPEALRRWVLAACGVVVLSAAVAPAAHATPGDGSASGAVAGGDPPVSALLDGLPLPDRPLEGAAAGALGAPTDPAGPAAPADPAGPAGPAAPAVPPPATSPGPARATGAHTVVPGDTLWDLAAAHLPPGSSDADVAAAVVRLHAAHRGVVGNDPDLILPGQRLDLSAALPTAPTPHRAP